MAHQTSRILLISFLVINFCSFQLEAQEKNPHWEKAENLFWEKERQRIDSLAELYWDAMPITITDFQCERSAGGKHDFYSEGDYWWPNLKNQDGPYIRKDGLSNPDNFSEHRHAMVRMSRIVGALTSKYLLSNNAEFADKALEHLRAWFVNDSTNMNPNLLYAQAIKGLYTGRGIGIIDGVHLIDVARSVYILHKKGAIPESDFAKIQAWFAQYLNWMQTHEYGIAEKKQANNHGTCWVLQAAVYAQLCQDSSTLANCSKIFATVLLPTQMATDGSFPLELARTKPYGYSLFNLDAFAILVQTLASEGNNLWDYELSDGRSMKKGLEYIYPFIIDKSAWKLKPDVLFWDEWPVRQPALFLAAFAYKCPDFLDTALKLNSDPEEDEVQRNLLTRYPVLWISKSLSTE